MRWQVVKELAANNGLELYTPLSGYHRQLQIIDRTTNRHWWTANKAAIAHQSLLCIVREKELAKLSTDEIIILANDIRSSLY